MASNIITVQATKGGAQMIVAKQVHKTFTIAQSKKGVLGSISSLFSRERKIVTAVENVSFTIEEGEAVGYIGPNGAGKSTTIKMLSGILHPTGGMIDIFGLSPQHQRKAVAKQIGVVFGQRTQLWWDLPVRDSFEILKAMYKVEDSAYRSALKRYDDLLDLGEFMETPVRKLSLGQRMRADLAAALIHNPRILFLDEPTIGLDVVAKGRIRHFLREINQTEKKTILLTTHDMDDIEHICRRVIMINHGKIVMDGTLDDLRQHIGLPSILRVEFSAAPAVRDLAGVEKMEIDGHHITLLYDKNKVSSPKLIAEVSSWGEPTDIQMSDPDIEEIIRRMY